MKKNRQEKILELVTQHSIGTQDELIAQLNACGYGATQATVSRDIRALKLLKVLTDSGEYRYMPPRKEETASSEQQAISYRKTYAEAIISIAHAMNNVVIKTTPGMASAVAVVLDRINHDLMLGCVAGDDTILVVTQTPEAAKMLAENVQEQSK